MENGLMKEKQYITLRYKLRYTLGILLVYTLGQKIPLYGIDIRGYENHRLGAAELLMQAIGGEPGQISLFALGISPYLLSAMLVQLFNAIKGAVTKSKISPKKTGKLTIITTLLYACIQAVVHVEQFSFIEIEVPHLFIRCLVIFELITGVMVIVWLIERNKKYGIGGQTILIYINILNGIISTIGFQQVRALIIPMCIGFLLMGIMIIMENTEMRIPVQRISIHNVYADKNYQAIKLSPMGVMPIMFSTAVFRLPQVFFALLHQYFSENESIAWWNSNMIMTRKLGVVMYIVIIYVLTIGFSFIFLSPWDLTDQFLKSGDSIVNLHAGRDTRRYLVKTVLTISFFSATVMGVCVGIPLFLQQKGKLDSALVMLPTSIMMLAGIWCNLYREFRTIRDYDSYRSFI